LLKTNGYALLVTAVAGVGQLVGEQFGGRTVFPAVMLLVSTYTLRVTARLKGKNRLPGNGKENPSSSSARAVWTPDKVTIETAASSVAANRRFRFLKIFVLAMFVFIDNLSSEVLGLN
jgi:hypothetical protein